MDFCCPSVSAFLVPYQVIFLHVQCPMYATGWSEEKYFFWRCCTDSVLQTTKLLSSSCSLGWFGLETETRDWLVLTGPPLAKFLEQQVCKWCLRNIMHRYYGGSFEHGNEPSALVRCGEFLDQLNNCCLLSKGSLWICTLCKWNSDVTFFGAFAKLQKKTSISFGMSVYQHGKKEHSPPPTRRSDILRLLESPSRKFKFNVNLTRITGTLHEYLCTFMVLSLGIHLRMRNLGDKSCRENHNTRFFLTFLKIVPFMTCGKICWGHAGYGWQYNRPHALCMPVNVGNNTDISFGELRCWRGRK
jgi:hypothetical protein